MWGEGRRGAGGGGEGCSCRCKSAHTFSNKPELGSPLACSLLVLILGSPCGSSGTETGRAGPRRVLAAEHLLGRVWMGPRGGAGQAGPFLARAPMLLCLPQLAISCMIPLPLPSLQRKQPPNTFQLQVQLLRVVDLAHGSRGHSSARSPVAQGEQTRARRRQP